MTTEIILQEQGSSVTALSGNKIYLVKHDDNGNRFVCEPQSEMFTMRKLDEDHPEEVKPILNLRSGEWIAFVQKILEYAQENNIKPKHEHYTKGKLDATEAHLNDLRKLLKLTK